MPCNDAVFQEIKKIVDENGSVTDKTKNRLILLGLTELHTCMIDIQESLSQVVEHEKRLALVEDHVAKENVEQILKDLEELKNNSLLLWIKTNPKVAITIGVIIFLLLSNNIIQEIIMQLLGIKLTLP